MTSLINILFSDNNIQSSFYINNDINPECFLSYLKKTLIEIDNDGKNDRLNWNYFSSKLLGKILLKFNKTENLSTYHENFYTFSYRYEIKPIEEKYMSIKNNIIDTINIKIYDSEDVVLVDNLLSLIQNKDLLTKNDFVFKHLNKEEIIDYLNNKSNFENITTYDQKFLLSNYTKNNIEETLDFFKKFKANNNLLIKHTILNSGYEILRADDWIIVSYLGSVEKLIMGYELTNGTTTPENNLFVIVGHDSSIIVQNDGTVFYSNFN